MTGSRRVVGAVVDESGGRACRLTVEFMSTVNAPGLGVVDCPGVVAASRYRTAKKSLTEVGAPATFSVQVNLIVSARTDGRQM
jgi:hypothetical protein